MGRWLIELSGDRMDLEEFPRWFPDGKIFAIEEKGRFFLTGPEFDCLPNVEAVRNDAIGALDRFWAVISLLWSGVRRPTISSISQETDEGGRSTYVLISGSATLRAKASGTLEVGGIPATPGPTQAQELLRIAKQSPNLDIALSVWAHPYRSWAQLYRILGEVEKYLGEPVNKKGFCSDNKRERFRRTANSAEAAGIDARHEAGGSRKPDDPMSLEEGTSFIADILLTVLQNAA